MDIGTLLVTGGTGTFGGAVVRRLLRDGAGEIRVLSRDEKKQDDMRREFASPRLRFYLGDVRDRASLEDAMVGVDSVFHAAALKQVPSCEFYPMQALLTNAMGAENVLAVAEHAGVKSVVVLSTDKAVYPINAMGISKAMMEKLMVARARHSASTGCCMCGTRYGNVMGSRGSVIPLLLQQALAGQPLTLTDPAMTRFMMTIDDALELVLYAFANGRPGDMFIQKAPACTIETLAEAVKRLCNSNSPVRVIGTRHGEKLYETLLTREEMAKAVDHGAYYRVPADQRDLNYDLFFSEGDASIARAEEYNSHNTRQLDVNEVVDLLTPLEFVQTALAGT